MLDTSATLHATGTIKRSSPRMVKRRNSQYKAFDWGAPRGVKIDCTPNPAGPMKVAPLGRKRLKKVWSVKNPGGAFVL